MTFKIEKNVPTRKFYKEFSLMNFNACAALVVAGHGVRSNLLPFNVGPDFHPLTIETPWFATDRERSEYKVPCSLLLKFVYTWYCISIRIPRT